MESKCFQKMTKSYYSKEIIILSCSNRIVFACINCVVCISINYVCMKVCTNISQKGP